MSWDYDVLAKRIDAKCQPDEHGCLIWTGAINSRGYACMGAFGKVQQVHRVAHVLFYGKVHDGPLDHICTVRHCVNPLHVEQVTTAENNRRAVRKRDAERVRGGVRHCPAGHPIAGDNAKPNGRGGAKCRSCANSHMREVHARTRADGPRFDGSEIKALRKALGWSQQAVAVYLGISSSGQVIVSEWERGRAATPKRHIEALWQALEVAA
jgi:DNA-binding transcriptional regulator YiaG